MNYNLISHVTVCQKIEELYNNGSYKFYSEDEQNSLENTFNVICMDCKFLGFDFNVLDKLQLEEFNDSNMTMKSMYYYLALKGMTETDN